LSGLYYVTVSELEKLEMILMKYSESKPELPPLYMGEEE